MNRPLLVTIATQRSGTKFLGAALNSGALLRSFGEPFKPPPPQSPFPGFAAGWIAAHPGFAFRSADFAAMLNGFFDMLEARAAEEGRSAHLDVMYNNLGAFSGIWSWPVRPRGESLLVSVMRARGAGVVHLVRDSLAECVASTIVAEHRGYHRRTALVAGDHALRLRADLTAAEATMRAILNARHFVRRAFRAHGRYVELAYPNFIANDTLSPAALEGIAALLGLAGEQQAGLLAGPSALRPTAPDKADVIENWDDLVALEAKLRATWAEEPVSLPRAPASRPSPPFRPSLPC